MEQKNIKYWNKFFSYFFNDEIVFVGDALARDFASAKVPQKVFFLFFLP